MNNIFLRQRLLSVLNRRTSSPRLWGDGKMRMCFESVCFALLTSLSSASWALNPVDGNYAGVFLGPSYSPGSSFTLDQPASFIGPNASVSFQSGSIQHSVLGDVGIDIGYRFCTNYRLEIEGFYNNNHFKSLKLNDLSYSSPYFTPGYVNTSVTFSNVENSSDAHIQGDTNTGAGMINAYYDLFIPGQDGYSSVVPFVGLGVGFSYVQNALQFYRAQLPNTTETNDSREIFEVWQKRTALAGQIMGGLNYFMDDLTWFALDLRYWATKSNTPTSTYTIITPTSRFDSNSSVNLFGSSTQLISINLSFNGVFNFG